MKKIQCLCIFILCAALIQGVVIIAFTHIGEDLIYPFVRRMFAEKIDITDNSYAEYYNIRDYVKQSNIIIIGADGRISGTYNVISDFLKFVKQNININIVALEIKAAEGEIITDCILSQDDIQFLEQIKRLENYEGMSIELIPFVESLYKINRIMPPDRKITVAGLDSASSSDDKFFESLNLAVQNTEKNILAVVRSERLAYGAEFRSLALEKLPDVLMTEIIYNNCTYSDNSDIFVRNDLYFPAFTNNFCVHLIRKTSTEKFTEYYKLVTNSTETKNSHGFLFSIVISNAAQIPPVPITEALDQTTEN